METGLVIAYALIAALAMVIAGLGYVIVRERHEARDKVRRARLGDPDKRV